MGEIDIAWCPGCGNFAILNALKQALSELEFKPEKLVVVSGIGQAAKAPHYYKCNLFNGLHGRSLPVATAIKAANPELMSSMRVGMAACMAREETTSSTPSEEIRISPTSCTTTWSTG